MLQYNLAVAEPLHTAIVVLLQIMLWGIFMLPESLGPQ